jgi:hypothetical protein
LYLAQLQSSNTRGGLGKRPSGSFRASAALVFFLADETLAAPRPTKRFQKKK